MFNYRRNRTGLRCVQSQYHTHAVCVCAQLTAGAEIDRVGRAACMSRESERTRDADETCTWRETVLRHTHYFRAMSVIQVISHSPASRRSATGRPRHPRNLLDTDAVHCAIEAFHTVCTRGQRAGCPSSTAPRLQRQGQVSCYFRIRAMESPPLAQTCPPPQS